LQDETFLAFEDIKPASAVHYLVVPRKHIGSSFCIRYFKCVVLKASAVSVRTLKPEDVQLGKHGSFEKILL
jgi:hypothetical protein